MAVSFQFANIFMAAVETEIINRSDLSRSLGKDISMMSFLYGTKEEINTFIELTNDYRQTIKFTAEISDNFPRYMRI